MFTLALPPSVTGLSAAVYHSTAVPPALAVT
jgi:hypothetical protein